MQVFLYVQYLQMPLPEKNRAVPLNRLYHCEHIFFNDMIICIEDWVTPPCASEWFGPLYQPAPPQSAVCQCVWTVSGVCCWRLTFSGHFAKAETEDVSDVFLYMYHSKQRMYIYNQTAFCSIH